MCVKYEHQQSIYTHTCSYTELELCVYVLSFQENLYVKMFLNIRALNCVAKRRELRSGDNCPGP